MPSNELSNPERANPELAIGDRVRLAIAPPYFKTAEPMPMLRPPDLVSVGAEGTVTEQRPGGSWVVNFERGRFLLDGQYLTAMDQSHGGAERGCSAESSATAPAMPAAGASAGPSGETEAPPPRS